MGRSSKQVRQVIIAVHEEWLEHELAGNMSGVLSLCADDVVWLPPNEPALRGKTAVAAWLAALPRPRIRRIDITNLRIECSGSLAYKLADFTTWVDPGEPAGDRPLAGTHLWVLRQAPRGHWRVALVAWSTAGPASKHSNQGARKIKLAGHPGHS